MGAVALALAASVGYGVSDFLGGLKSRRLPVMVAAAVVGIAVTLCGAAVVAAA